MNFKVRFTRAAEADLVRLYEFILARDGDDWTLAEDALAAIKEGVRQLAFSPFSCRKASRDNAFQRAFLRELVIPFGAAGYVALFEIDDSNTVTVLAVRHQREEDYH